MEEKIYQRQVTKQSLSKRVVDEHQVDRHFTMQELEELYKFEPDVYDEAEAMTLPMPDDDVFADVILLCKRWLLGYHEHDSLLENRPEENLSDEDRKAAWADYENEKKLRDAPPPPPMSAEELGKLLAMAANNGGYPRLNPNGTISYAPATSSAATTTIPNTTATPLSAINVNHPTC